MDRQVGLVLKKARLFWKEGALPSTLNGRIPIHIHMALTKVYCLIAKPYIEEKSFKVKNILITDNRRNN